MHGDRQAHRHFHLSEPFDPRDPAHGRDRRPAMPHPEVRKALARFKHALHVEHRLSHAHEHAMVDRFHPAEVQRLIDDLRGAEVAAEPHSAGGAEPARERTARLR